MSDILIFKNEFNEFVDSVEKLTQELFKTKRILKFISNNGINCFEFISSDIYLTCNYCSYESHKLHENKYSYEVLVDILEENWVNDIFGVYLWNIRCELLSSHLRCNSVSGKLSINIEFLRIILSLCTHSDSIL